MPTLVLIHSAATTRAAWQPQVGALAGRFRVLTPDLPGYGDSAGPFSVDRAADQVAALIGAETGVHVCGLSAGATVAVRLAATHPAAIESLILSGLPPRTPPLAAALRGLVLAVTPASALAGPGGGVSKTTAREVARALAHEDLRPDLARVRARTLVLCGSKDTAQLAPARQAASQIGGAELRIIPDAGHLWNAEQPELFASTIASWALAQLPAR